MITFILEKIPLYLTYCRTKIGCHQRFYLYTAAAQNLPRYQQCKHTTNKNRSVPKRALQNLRRIPCWLDEFHAGWNSHKRYECLIHSDIKSDNFLTVESLNSPDSSSHSSSDMYKKTRHLKLIDWELARIGDPAWDTGCVFSDYLALWLFSLPIINRESSPDSFLKLALYPLHKMQPAIRSYWNSYVRKMRFDVNESNEFLVRSVRYCSAQLVRKAYEYLQRQVKISANIVYLLQVSLNIMKDPQTAITSLLGISSC
jgi:serine/threonine protein kinase